MKTKSEIERLVQSRLEQEQGIIFAYLFGSFIESETFRDVDLGLYMKKEGNDKFQDLCIHLAVELERLLDVPVDVVPLNNAPDHFVHQVSRGKVLVDRDPEFRYNFITRVWKRYFDIQPKRLQAVVDMFG